MLPRLLLGCEVVTWRNHHTLLVGWQLDEHVVEWLIINIFRCDVPTLDLVDREPFVLKPSHRPQLKMRNLPLKFFTFEIAESDFFLLFFELDREQVVVVLLFLHVCILICHGSLVELVVVFLEFF